MYNWKWHSNSSVIVVVTARPSSSVAACSAAFTASSSASLSAATVSVYELPKFLGLKRRMDGVVVLIACLVRFTCNWHKNAVLALQPLTRNQWQRKQKLPLDFFTKAATFESTNKDDNNYNNNDDEIITSSLPSSPQSPPHSQFHGSLCISDRDVGVASSASPTPCCVFGEESNVIGKHQ